MPNELLNPAMPRDPGVTPHPYTDDIGRGDEVPEEETASPHPCDQEGATPPTSQLYTIRSSTAVHHDEGMPEEGTMKNLVAKFQHLQSNQ